jgi:hypothetical protein
VIKITQNMCSRLHHVDVLAALHHPSSLETVRFPGGPFPFKRPAREDLPVAKACR